jgi:hypothetical protein
MSVVLPLPFYILFVLFEPIVMAIGAYVAFTTPEWFLTSLVPGPNVSGLLHTKETNMLVGLYGVLLILLTIVYWAIFLPIANRSDSLSFSIARRFLFALAGTVSNLLPG